MAAAEFRLTKWYLDAVGADGRAFVGHHAALVWHGLRLHHAAIMGRDASGRVTERWGSRGATPPSLDGAGVRWSPAHPAVAGRWTPRDAAIAPGAAQPHRLLATAEGAVVWTCLLPAADAVITLPDGGRLEARGYVERLELAIRPWALPIEELRWGRFIGEARSLVWIDWRGPAPLSLALLDGRPARVASVADGAVELAEPAARLLTAPRATLREGLLGGSALGRVPLLARSLPLRMLQVHERRWLADGELEVRGERERGEVLQELVRWP